AIDGRHATEIHSICNEPLVYRWLFAERLKDEPYSIAMARDFLTWAGDGWKDQTHFVFVAFSPGGQVVAACDIKSNDVVDAEIGYWAGSKHAGVMTPAVGALCQIAKQAGYTALHAWTRTGNDRSAMVLQRNGFRPADTLPEKQLHRLTLA